MKWEMRISRDNAGVRRCARGIQPAAVQEAAPLSFLQCPAHQEGTPPRGRRVPRNGGRPDRTRFDVRLQGHRQPDAGRFEGKRLRPRGRSRKQGIGRFPGLVARAGATVIGRLLPIVFTATAAAGLLLFLRRRLLRRATAQRTGDQKRQQTGEDGSETRHDSERRKASEHSVDNREPIRNQARRIRELPIPIAPIRPQPSDVRCSVSAIRLLLFPPHSLTHLPRAATFRPPYG